MSIARARGYFENLTHTFRPTMRNATVGGTTIATKSVLWCVRWLVSRITTLTKLLGRLPTTTHVPPILLHLSCQRLVNLRHRLPLPSHHVSISPKLLFYRHYEQPETS